SELPEGAGDGNRTLAGHSGRGDAVDGAGGKVDAVFLRAVVGYELDRIAAPGKLLRERRRGKEMPPRASGGEQDRADAHAAFSLTLRASASGSADGGAIEAEPI